MTDTSATAATRDDRAEITGTDASGPGRQAGRGTLLVFTLASFLGAALLFLIEPMVTKMLLPLLGGTPAVWNTAMVFFQAALLGGYLFAHVTISGMGTRRQPIVQIIGLAVPLLLLPVAVPSGWRPPVGSSPAAWTLLALTVMVGAPFLMLSTTGPTLQRWFSATTHPHAPDPYFLYAAGNIGSLLALIAYPLVIEPNLSLTQQSRAWTVLYLLFAVLTLLCALLLRRARLGPVPDAASPGADVPARTAAVARRRGSDGPAARPALSVADAGRSPSAAPITARTRLRWIYLAAIPSALMLGVTRHIGTDVASMPLLWVIPLSLYLITFIVAFGRRSSVPARISARALKLLVIPLALSFYGLVGSLWLALALHLSVFFAAAMVAHGRLATERPTPERLTEFYLLLSVGGVVGGIVTALIAPVVFNSVLEYPIAIVLALTVLPASAFAPSARRRSAAPDVRRPDILRRDEDEAPASGGPAQVGAHRFVSPRAVALGLAVVVVAVAAVAIRSSGTQQSLTISILVAAAGGAAAYMLVRTPLGYAGAVGTLLLAALVVPANPTLHEQRTFFGVHRVYEDLTNDRRHVLLNGTTVHGMEDFVGPHAGQPTTYYHPTGPIGQYFEQRRADPRPAKVGLIGLGSGALAAYGRPGDHLTYYEIDDAVIDIAERPNLFTFVADSAATIDFKLGDGRLELENATEARYDVLVIDAFSGDAIPVHLITNEAMALYERRTSAHGVIAFHISNRYFDFAPVLARLAEAQGLTAYIQDDPATDAQAAEGKLEATWVLLARSPADLGPLAQDPRWSRLGPAPTAPLWTDDYSDLLHVFRWQG